MLTLYRKRCRVNEAWDLNRFGGVEIDEARVLAASSTPPPPECRLENCLDRSVFYLLKVQA